MRRNLAPVKTLFQKSLPALALFLLVAPALSAQPYEEETQIEITGAVADADGNPLSGRTVILEAYRPGFNLRKLNMRNKKGRTRKGLVQRSAVTDAQGAYTIWWPWFDYYTRFELSVGTYQADGSYQVEELVDLTRRIQRGTPVRVSFTIGGNGASRNPASSMVPTTPVSNGSAPTRSATTESPSFSTSYDTGSGSTSAQADLRARYGEPDEIESLNLPYGEEETYWYFSEGRAFKFLDGELREELTFRPVRPF